jgi:DNA-binding NtrC family response regulator
MTVSAAKALPVNSDLPVLLIEDEPAVMDLIRTTLERSGYTVTCSGSGVEGLKLLEQGDFLGVVSDMRTPGGVDGADVHAWVERYRPDLASKVVLITGDIADEETVAKLRKTGAPWVEKPFRVQHFISVVERTMGKAL